MSNQQLRRHDLILTLAEVQGLYELVDIKGVNFSPVIKEATLRHLSQNDFMGRQITSVSAI